MFISVKVIFYRYAYHLYESEQFAFFFCQLISFTHTFLYGLRIYNFVLMHPAISWLTIVSLLEFRLFPVGFFPYCK